MKKDWSFFLVVWAIVTLGLIGAAIYLAIKQIEGWGWFLFLAALMLAGISYNDNKNDKEEDDES